MQKLFKILYGVFISAFILAAIIVPLSFVNFKNRAYDPINDGYILIENNRDFRRYNFPGSGTTADPYIIENFVFNVQPPFVDAI
ncbi:MAG: hypothetical protein ACTSVP_11115, partial [Candidatus Heimdallarchaeota archaeon]